MRIWYKVVRGQSTSWFNFSKWLKIGNLYLCIQSSQVRYIIKTFERNIYFIALYIILHEANTIRLQSLCRVEYLRIPASDFFCTKLSGTRSDGIKYSGHMWHFLFCFRYSLSVFTRSRVIFLHNYATCYSYDSPGKYYVFCLMKFNKETKLKTRKNTHIHRDLWRWLWAQCVECPHFRRPPPHKALCRNTVGCHSCQRSRCGWI